MRKLLEFLGMAFLFVVFMPLCILSGIFWNDYDQPDRMLILLSGTMLTVLYYLVIIWIVGQL